MLIMLDGIDGSGKSTIIEAWKKYLTDKGNAIFDLKNYLKTKDKYPDFPELKSYDFIFNCEPTYTGVGKVIREEIIKDGAGYPGRAAIDAFSLDRLVLYKKIIIPLLKEKKCVIQDRGVSTSLAYQPIQAPESGIETVVSAVGNQLALEYRPDHLVITKIDPESAMKRLLHRTEKSDQAVFEHLDFLKKLAAAFESEEYKKIFTDRSAQIHYLNAGAEIGIMKREAIKLFERILNSIKK